MSRYDIERIAIALVLFLVIVAVGIMVGTHTHWLVSLFIGMVGGRLTFVIWDEL